MKFVTLKSFDKKKLLIPTLIITSLILVVTLFVSHAEFTSTDHVTIVDGVINYTPYDFKVMAMYIQQNSCIDTNNKNCYQEVEAMPSKGYTINETKSYCFINNENEKITGKVYTNSDGEHIIKDLEKRSKCIIYFDAIPGYYGTEENPIIINSINDLVELSNSVNSGNTYEGLYIKLEKDLDFQKDADYEDVSIKNAQISGSGFTTIGSNSYPFMGTFDGNNHIINSLYINYQQTDKEVALFGFVNNGTIKNITVSGNVTATNFQASGIIYRATNSVIENVINKINVNGAVSNSTNGGIIGEARSNVIVTNSSNYGNIQDSNNIGGIVGIVADNTTLKIDNCHNYGTLTQTLGGGYIGGLIGRDNGSLSKIIVTNSHNAGEIISNNEIERAINLGGIIGRSYGSITIDNSYNSGNIINNKKTYEANQSLSLGGLIGNNNTYEGKSAIAVITNSYNTGSISGGNRVGGLIGCNTENAVAIIDGSTNHGKISSDVIAGTNASVAGGLVGYNNNSNIYILNSYNTGNISNPTSNSYGINSVENTVNIINNVYNIGTLEGKTKYELGFINSDMTYSINNFYYKNDSGIKGSNITDNEIIGMSSTEMTNKTFTDTLNNNINSINLSEIFKDESNEVKEIINNIKLIDWIQSEEGYPVLNYKN